MARVAFLLVPPALRRALPHRTDCEEDVRGGWVANKVCESLTGHYLHCLVRRQWKDDRMGGERRGEWERNPTVCVGRWEKWEVGTLDRGE
ncbi:hypothetical protein QBC44DRAFT_321953 [Cladorrhinum sp. PSN332]|nr:hypothetical protein QBC44DRAFT_321953 [Cladorrhinum sp. PSN332]